MEWEKNDWPEWRFFLQRERNATIMVSHTAQKDCRHSKSVWTIVGTHDWNQSSVTKTQLPAWILEMSNAFNNASNLVYTALVTVLLEPGFSYSRQYWRMASDYILVLQPTLTYNKEATQRTTYTLDTSCDKKSFQTLARSTNSQICGH